VPAHPIFIFQTDEFWLNLHHFLYVLGRAENKETNASRAAVAGAPADQEKGVSTLSSAERAIWSEAVKAYAAGPSKKDLIFDDPMPAVTAALARAGNAPSLTGAGIDPAIASVLERAAPIYRKAWWLRHEEANHAWQTMIQVLVDRHGASVLAYITKAYQMDWPAAGFTVHLSGYSNWAGAYSTRGHLLVVSSLDEATRGTLGLETVFHEGMHQWDEQVFLALRTEARRQNKLVAANLSHALIFFTAGEAVRSVVPAHVPYAIKSGIWERMGGSFKQVLDEVWKPYLDGHGTREEALKELVKRTATEPRPAASPDAVKKPRDQ
jgi:hypothetical protein